MSSDNRPIRLLHRLSADQSQICQVDALSTGSFISVIDLNTSSPFIPRKPSTRKSMTTSQKSLVASVLDGNVQCGSDGSARHNSMSSATWFGSATDPTIIARPVHGPTIDSYRTEMDGVLHFLETLHPVQHQISTTTNTPVVNFSNSWDFEVTAANIDQPYSPQKLAIRNYMRDSVHSFDFSYVNSHQDDVKDELELSIEERNNVRCDAEAKIVSRKYVSQELPSSLPYGLEICLESSQGLILEKIYAHLSSSIYFDYIQRHLSLTPHQLWQIDWNLHGMILKKIRKKDEILTRRIIWRKHYTMKDKFTQGNSETPRCPLCECDNEKFHFLRCRNIKASKEAQQAFYQLKQEIVKLNISPIMWHIICSHLEDLSPPLSGEDRLDSQLIVVYEQQNMLSQEQFLFGRLVGDFYEIATDTYDPTKKKMSRSTYPKIWASILRYVCALWRIRSKFCNQCSENLEKATALQESQLYFNGR